MFLFANLADPDIPEIDLAFALSATAFDAAGNFRRMKEIVNYIIRRYGQDKIRYSVLIFGQGARIRIGFQDLIPNSDRLAAYISTLSKYRGGPRMDLALAEARKLFVNGGGTRPGARKVSVLFV